MNESIFYQKRPSIITTTGLTKKFGKLVAVDNLQLEVKQGDVFGFLGSNGSGKTKTIRMLLGLLRPSAGRKIASHPRSSLLPGTLKAW